MGSKCDSKHANSEVETRLNARCTLGERGLLKPATGAGNGRSMQRKNANSEADTRMNAQSTLGERGVLKPAIGA